MGIKARTFQTLSVYIFRITPSLLSCYVNFIRRILLWDHISINSRFLFACEKLSGNPEKILYYNKISVLFAFNENFMITHNVHYFLEGVSYCYNGHFSSSVKAFSKLLNFTACLILTPPNCF